MASITSPSAHCSYRYKTHTKQHKIGLVCRRICLCQQPDDANKPIDQTRREIILRSSELAVVGAIFNLGGKKPEYLGVQKNQQALALCPATKNCISTSENIIDVTHFAPSWNYNGNRKKPVDQEVAWMSFLLRAGSKDDLNIIELYVHICFLPRISTRIESTKPDRFTPQIVEQRDDYVHVEYQSPILGLVDDVEFWFPSGNGSIVEYRAASRVANYDFDYNRKRIKALRLALEKKGWTSQETF